MVLTGKESGEGRSREREGVGDGVAGDGSIMLKHVEETRRSLATCTCLATDSNICLTTN